MITFQSKKIEEYPEVIELQNKINNLDKEISEYEKQIEKLSSQIGPEKEKLKELKIKLELGETTQKEVDQQSKKVEALKKQTDDDKKHSYDKIQYKSKALEILLERLSTVKEQTQKKRIEEANQFVKNYKSKKLSEFYEFLTALNELRKAEQFICTETSPGSIKNNFYNLLIPSALAHIDIMLSDEYDYDLANYQPKLIKRFNEKFNT